MEGLYHGSNMAQGSRVDDLWLIASSINTNMSLPLRRQVSSDESNTHCGKLVHNLVVQLTPAFPLSSNLDQLSLRGVAHSLS